MTPSSDPHHRLFVRMRRIRRVLLCVLLVSVGVFIFSLQDSISVTLLNQSQNSTTTANLIFLSVLYAFCLATPFMPGLELGLIVMFLFGLPGIVATYVATLVGLVSAFLVGRLGLQHYPMSISSYNKGHILSKMQSHPYLLIAITLNMPGNWVVGGGGGISILAGLKQELSFLRFLATICLAILPLPLLVMFGMLTIDQLGIT